jgi:hypothetical protein
MPYLREKNYVYRTFDHAQTKPIKGHFTFQSHKIMKLINLIMAYKLHISNTYLESRLFKQATISQKLMKK